MTNSHELSRLNLDFEVVLVVVVVATTCTTYSRPNYWSSFKERTREVQGGSRWTGNAQHPIGYKNLFWPIRSKIYKSLWNCSCTNSWPGALPLLFFLLNFAAESSAKLSNLPEEVADNRRRFNLYPCDSDVL